MILESHCGATELGFPGSGAQESEFLAALQVTNAASYLGIIFYACSTPANSLLVLPSVFSWPTCSLQILPTTQSVYVFLASSLLGNPSP